MANDLISKSALIKKFDDATIEIKLELPIQEVLGEDVDIEDFFMLVQEIMQQYRKMTMDTIQNQPTAYNVDKVVEEIKEWSFETEIVIPGSDGYDDTANREIICTGNAIDIVRKGGVE